MPVIGSLQETVTLRLMILCGIALVVFGIFLSQQVTILAADIAYHQTENEHALNETGTIKNLTQ